MEVVIRRAWRVPEPGSNHRLNWINWIVLSLLRLFNAIYTVSFEFIVICFRVFSSLRFFCYSHGISYYNYVNFAIFFYITNLPTLFNFYITFWTMLTPTQITKTSSRKKKLFWIYLREVVTLCRFRFLLNTKVQTLQFPKWFRFTKKILLRDFWEFSGAPQIRDHAHLFSHISFQYINM